MPNPINSATTADAFSDAATISGVFKSNGGTFDIAGNSVLYALEYGSLGDTHWTEDVLARPGAGFLIAGTTGIRFRSALAGMPATVSAFIAPRAQPFAQVAATASAATAPSGVITGIIPAAGTTPTSGTGFTYTHTNGTGVYVFTFTTAFAAIPAVLATIDGTSPRFVSISAISASGFTVNTFAFAGGPNDEGFTFVAQTVV